MNCATVRDDLGAYALGVLEPGEARAIRAHLLDCDGCRSEANAYSAVSSAVALTSPFRPPPGALRARVLSAVGAAEGPAAAPGRLRRLWPWAVAAAVALGLLSGLLAWSIVLQRQVDDLQDEQRQVVGPGGASDAVVDELGRLQVHEELFYLLLQDDAAHVEMEGAGVAASASALYAWSPGERKGILLCQGLPEAPAGMTYQLWLRTGAGELDGGTFAPDASGAAQLVVRRPPSVTPPPTATTPQGLQEVLVTLEPAGGSASLSGPVVLRSTISQ